MFYSYTEEKKKGKKKIFVKGVLKFQYSNFAIMFYAEPKT